MPHVLKRYPLGLYTDNDVTHRVGELVVESADTFSQRALAEVEKACGQMQPRHPIR